MTVSWSAASMMRASRPPSNGAVLMLQCFFDDSGSHGGSKVVVWGGVIGTIEQFDRLETQWNDLLHEPLPGRPPLRKFHLFRCRERMGEFETYSDAEADRLQFLFRTIMIESGVIPVAFGACVASWNTMVTGRLKEVLGTAESASLGCTIKRAIEYAEVNPEMQMTIAFDKGRMLEVHQTLFQAVETLFPEAVGRCAKTFLPVEGTPGMQAADMVANYFYRYTLQWLEDPNSDPEPHFLHLLKNRPHDESGVINECGVFNADAIQALLDGMRDKRPDLWAD